MGRLSESKLKALGMVIEAAPDRVLLAIRAQMMQAGGAAATAVLDQVQLALADRAAMQAVLSPIIPLCGSRELSIHDEFRADVPRRLWRAVVARRPDQTGAIVQAALQGGLRELPARLADGLCAEAAAIVRASSPTDFGFTSQGEADRFCSYLDLAPVARTATDRLEDWIGRLDEERAAALRLTFRDADQIRDDARPLLMDMLAARLPCSARVMRLISAITDNAQQGFVGSTELARIGERLVSHAETLAARSKIGGRAFTPQDAVAANRDLQAVADIIAEFDLAFPPTEKAGAWTSRLSSVRKRLTGQLETALREVEKTVGRAFPSNAASARSQRKPERHGANGADPRDRARALVYLAAGTRGPAAAFGCESLRRQAAEAAADRLDRFGEDLIHALHSGDAPEQDEARALLDLTAELLGLARNEEAGTLLRRRAAVASRDWTGDAAA